MKEAQTLTGTEALAPSLPLEPPSWQSVETVGYNWSNQPPGPISGPAETLSRVRLPFSDYVICLSRLLEQPERLERHYVLIICWTGSGFYPTLSAAIHTAEAHTNSIHAQHMCHLPVDILLDLQGPASAGHIRKNTGTRSTQI